MRWRNKGLWVSIFSLIGLILGNYGLYDTLGLTADSYKNIVDGVLAVLVTAGIISNPTTKNTGFKDDK